MDELTGKWLIANGFTTEDYRRYERQELGLVVAQDSNCDWVWSRDGSRAAMHPQTIDDAERVIAFRLERQARLAAEAQ